MKECCANCIHYCKLEKLDYTDGCVHTEMDGFACDLFTNTIFTGGKRFVNWMVNTNPEIEQCECWEGAE